MNYGSPLSKDTRQVKKKTEELEKFKPEKLKLSLATTKKVLKSLKVAVGHSECQWLNFYVENEVRSRCLPLSFLSNDFLSSVETIFGAEGAKAFLDTLKAAFLLHSPKNVQKES
jgi:hypothetical protein